MGCGYSGHDRDLINENGFSFEEIRAAKRREQISCREHDSV
jgi:hypothetical protein